MNAIGTRLAGLALIAVSCLPLSACGRWSPDRYDRAAAEHIDARLQIGMSLAAFRERYPAAVRLEPDSGQERYLISHNEVCLLCRTGHGFLVSEDVFARLAMFEAERLVAIEPVESGAR